MRASLLPLAMLALGAGTAAAAAEEKVLNVFTWPDYIAPDTIRNFEAAYGIKVNYDVYDSTEMAEARLLAGRTGYDVVAHAERYSARLIPIGVYQPLDKSKLPNLKNLDPWVLETLDSADPGNRYGVPYLWGTTGFAYNEKMIRERMPDAPVKSGDMLFKPEVVKKFADCGVTFLDEPTDVIPMALLYLGRDPNSLDPTDLADVERLLKSVRPYIRYFSSAKMLIDLPNEEVCIAMSWSGDYAQAMLRAQQVGKPVDLAYTTQSEGSLAWFDLWFIPADAPHPDNAHLFLNYLLRPEVAAPIVMETRYATPNLKAIPLLPASVRNDPAVFPPESEKSKLYKGVIRDPISERRRSRLWSRVKTGLMSETRPSAPSRFAMSRSAYRRHDRGRQRVARHPARRALRNPRRFRLRQDDAAAHAGRVRAPTAGRIVIDGVDMTEVPPYERPVNLMFQSYALFPHMTVEQNIAYGLKKERVPEPQIRERVAEMLALVKLDYSRRANPTSSPAARTSASRWRARSSSARNSCFSTSRSRRSTRSSVNTRSSSSPNLQYQLGMTFVVVTHDQDEAMTLSSRIAVMSEGRIAQIGTPAEVYEYPANRYVAGFVGNINLIEGRVSGTANGRLTLRSDALDTELAVVCEDAAAVNGEVCVAVRPEKITISRQPPESADRNIVKGTVRDLGYFGDQSLYRVRTKSGAIVQVSAQNLRRSAKLVVEWDDEVYLSWDVGSTILLRS